MVIVIAGERRRSRQRRHQAEAIGANVDVRFDRRCCSLVETTGYEGIDRIVVEASHSAVKDSRALGSRLATAASIRQVSRPMRLHSNPVGDAPETMNDVRLDQEGRWVIAAYAR
jgi:hypothetical protein